MNRYSMRAALYALTLGWSCFAAAVDKDSVTFVDWQPVQTSPANIEAGTLFTHVFTDGGYNLGRIRFVGHMDEINGVEHLPVGDYGHETRIRVKYPDGRYKDISVSAVGNYATPPGLDFAGDFRLALGEAAPFGGGTWKFYLVNSNDDLGDTLSDSRLNITFYLPATA